LLASGPVAEEKLGIWLISVVGATLKKLRDDGRAADFSPDGSQIVFIDGTSHDLWLMNADGGQAHLFAKLDAGFHPYSPIFFPDGHRIAYLRYGREGDNIQTVLESRDLKGGDPVVLLSSPQLTEFVFAQPGRLVLSQSELPPNQYDSNLWEMRFDPATGKPKGGPRRLTDWSGFTFYNIRITADNQRLVFLRDRSQSDVYVADLTKGKTLSPQRMTLNERLDWPAGWLDSKTVLFYSDRNGTFDIYKQAIGQRDAEAMVAGQDDKWAPQLTPDGKWIIFLQWPKTAPGATPPPGKIMRVPVGGGPAEAVLDVKGHPPIGSPFIGATVGGYPSFVCPRRGQAACILAEVIEKQLVFSAFDAQQGQRKEVAKLSLDPDYIAWDLSPDGDRIAISTFDFKAGDLQILPVAGGSPQKLSANPWKQISLVAWTADGKGLYLVSTSSRGDAVLRMNVNGAPELLLKWSSVSIEEMTPSPDGHCLGLGPMIEDSNAWMIDAFPEK
jgi:Tol biopolymer transport system component